MGFSIYNQFMPLANTLNAITTRQQMISDNIANAHTPGYTAKNVSFSDLLYNTQNPFETRLGQKMGASMQPLGPMDSGEPVSLQKQFIEMQKNMLFYSMTTRRTATIFSNLKTASQIGR